MSYATIEARVQTLAQGLTAQFASTSQVTLGGWRVLDSGKSPLLVISPGEFDANGASITGGVAYTWTLNLDLFVKFQNEETTYPAFGVVRDALLQHLQKYPTLNNLANVTQARVSAGGEPEPVFDQDGNGPFFLMERISMRVNEMIFVTTAE